MVSHRPFLFSDTCLGINLSSQYTVASTKRKPAIFKKSDLSSSNVEFSHSRETRYPCCKLTLRCNPIGCRNPLGGTDQGRFGDLDQNAAPCDRCNQHAYFRASGPWFGGTEVWKDTVAPLGHDVRFFTWCDFSGLLRDVSPIEPLDQIRWEWSIASRILCLTRFAHCSVVGCPPLGPASVSVRSHESNSQTSSNCQIRISHLAVRFHDGRYRVSHDFALLYSTIRRVVRLHHIPQVRWSSGLITVPPQRGEAFSPTIRLG